MNYEKQAEDFLKKTNTEFKVRFLEHNFYFTDEKNKRDIYEITLKRGERIYNFKFGNSVNASGKYIITTEKGILRTNNKTTINKYRANGFEVKKNKDFKEPTPYNVLASLTKYKLLNFRDFCDEYGYNTDSRRDFKTYKAVKEEYEELGRLYNDEEMEELRVIN